MYQHFESKNREIAFTEICLVHLRKLWQSIITFHHHHVWVWCRKKNGNFWIFSKKVAVSISLSLFNFIMLKRDNCVFAFKWENLIGSAHSYLSFISTKTCEIALKIYRFSCYIFFYVFFSQQVRVRGSREFSHHDEKNFNDKFSQK